MVAALDVFALRNKEPNWLGCTETLAKALELIRETGPGSYFVFSQVTNDKNFFEVSSGGVVGLVPVPKPS